MKPVFFKSIRAGLLMGLTLLVLSSCSPAAPAAPTPDIAQTNFFESALLTATYAVPVSTATPEPPTPTAVPTIPLTPPDLPAVYTSSLLNKNDTPHAYIKDTCEYLKMRWDPNNSAPGTVVMPIMFHSITDGDVVQDNQITHGFLLLLLKNLKDQGFETITSKQLADFLENNTKIPPRSVILILDDRRPGAVREHFLPVLEDYNWSLTLSWIIGAGEDSTDLKPASYINAFPEDSFANLWEQMEAYNKSGRLDVQAHGVVHNTPISSISTEDFIRSEMGGPITILEQHFGKRPIAYIWPGGGFTKHAAEIGRELGYRLGFTVNPRGPVMFNWVPLNDAGDPARPSYLPEGSIEDPLMTLPRYWDTDATNQIDNVRIIGKEAAEQAELTKATELQYYDVMCKPVIGELPTLAP
ncbi:MAG: polysaccharide deacetylase family protein [Anaerolineaceae bacterium]